ncbi:MAG: hypothetical protein LQ343_007230 [Gyalolechia ehrenbergii]|nr:MAG: hypothetical protein LQ343_007230 [Gyalolechia ehrenbergii]
MASPCGTSFYPNIVHPNLHKKIVYGCDGQKDMGRKGPYRGFEELNIYVSPPQAASERFPKPEECPPPRIAYLRNNLVALSQYYNLFFVASLDRILVYQPANQEQYLPTPKSTIQLASSNSGLTGYIDPANSHAINQLIVADLGIEELVVAVCDDGDVVAYTTRSIMKEIEHRAPDDYRSPDIVSELRPFFVNNVGMSAWGVAVHKEARMIAISSNSKKINIFVFALSDSSNGSSDVGDEGDTDSDLISCLPAQEWIQTSSPNTLNPSDRSRNIEIILSAHWNNIPNIAFFNSANPSDGEVFLVSTDIDGTTYIWSVWQRAVAKEYHLALESNRGWGVSCIDPYFCRNVGSFFELLGVENVSTSGAVVDTTRAAKMVPESSENHFTLRNRTANPYGSEDGQDDFESDEDEAMEDEYDEDFDAVDDLGLDEQTEDDDSEIEEDTEDVDASTQTTPGNAANTHEGATEEINMMLLNAPEPIRDVLRSQLEYLKPKVLPPRSKAESTVLPFYIFHTTRSDIRLLHAIRPSKDGMITRGSSKEVICRSPLHQHLRPEDSWLGRLERLNMVLQVPELGLVVVGDQTGRVALLTMTRCRAQCNDIKHDDVGFRLERFLPLMSQEDDNQRPKTELLGVAVGPIPSRLLKRTDALAEDDYGYGYSRRREAWREFEGSRRYRLILYYRDHTVLSYEIGRPIKGGLDVIDL